MVEETSLERFMIKLNFCKIVHTKNLSNEKAENIINGMYTEFPYIKRQVNNNYSWSGFTSEYIKPFKIDHKSNKKFFDDDIYELENNNNFNSKVYKCTFVMYDRTNPKFVDIFILPSLNFICIIGTKKFINVPNKYLKDALKINDIEYEEINFSHSFLMWVLWKLSLGYSISSEINIDFFDDLKVGLTNPKNISNDTTPNSIKTTGGGNEFPSLPICYGLFNKKTLNYLKGEFQYNNKEFEVKLNILKETNNNFKSEIFIYSNGCLSGLKHSQKLQLVLPFIYKLSHVVKKWENSKTEEKYPDEDYLNQLLENATSEFHDMLEAFDEFKKEHLSKINSESG